MTEKNNKNKKIVDGVVVSKKMKDTLTVRVDSFVKHPKYKKYIKKSKKFQVHAPATDKKLGDKVQIAETKPVSKTKKFKLVN